MEQEVLNISMLKEKLKNFAAERNWEQFHNPKNLAMALSVEASELVEIFQWLTHEQAFLKNSSDEKIRVGEEISDIFVYLLRICTVLDINLPEALERKMQINAQKYPVEKAKGSAKKYTEF